MVSLLTDPRGTVHRVLTPVRFVCAIALRVVWAAVSITGQFLYESCSYLYVLATGGPLPEIVPANPVTILVINGHECSRYVLPPSIEDRLLEAFWASYLTGRLFKQFVAEIKHAASSSSSLTLFPLPPEPDQVPLPLPPWAEAVLRRALPLPHHADFAHSLIVLIFQSACASDVPEAIPASVIIPASAVIITSVIIIALVVLITLVISTTVLTGGLNAILVAIPFKWIEVTSSLFVFAIAIIAVSIVTIIAITKRLYQTFKPECGTYKRNLEEEVGF
ncbi:hypothetical protein BG006_003429 [Podila minutissima]|uniref:Uncharacterized protein n=1 Tax=Podila minutissima TaxID=64525 RepID=A0A9P5S8M8_9FUNG|nr:hypothetical protein BG006_003429 [Podila minutissima]